MNRYIKISAALAAFALLLVVMGLSTQGTVQAQANPLSLAVGSNKVPNTDPAIDAVRAKYLCTHKDCGDTDATFTITVEDYNATTDTVTIQNLDLARVSQDIVTNPNRGEGEAATLADGPDANPKEIMITGGTAAVTAVHKSSGLTDPRFVDEDDDGDLDYVVGGEGTYQVKAFHGNRISVSFSRTGQLGFSDTLTVDNVGPNVLLIAPDVNLVTKKSVNITFSADITDGGAGFASDKDDLADSNNHALVEDNDVVADASVKGRIQFFVGQESVRLNSSNFTAIDDGWRVSKTLGSSDIQNLGDRVTWYFSAEDLAGNAKSSTGNLGGKTTEEAVEDQDAIGTMLVDDAYAGAGYPDGIFNARGLRYTTPSFTLDATQLAAITEWFDPLAPETPRPDFAVSVTEATVSPVTKMTTITTFTKNDGTFVVSSALSVTVTVLGIQSNLDTGIDEDPETVFLEASQARVRAMGSVIVPIPKGTSFNILSTHLVTVDGDAPEAGAPFVVTGNAWGGSPAGHLTGTKAKKNSIQITFTDTSGIDTSTVTASAFTVTGNSVSSVQVIDTRGQGSVEEREANSYFVFLTLADNLGSSERPSVTISSGIIKDLAGNAYGGRTSKAEDRLGPNLSLSRSAGLSKKDVTVTIDTDEQLNDLPSVTRSVVGKDGALSGADGSRLASQSAAQTYTYKSSISDIPGGAPGAKFNIYATGTDTQNDNNTGGVGDSKNGSSPKSFTFQLDRMLNGGQQPEVSVSDKVAEGSNKGSDQAVTDIPSVQQVDPLIVTLDFAKEAGEYSGDSYRTVELTSASMKITFADNTTKTTNYDLTTEVDTSDNIQFTIPVLNPRLGRYQLTLKAVDSAGNDNLTSPTATTAQSLVFKWEVVPAEPVEIKLKPGWNLISLPFRPASSAINSVIEATHPADIVMTFDNINKLWQVSRRDAETGLFVGDIPRMTATTAYFVHTINYQPIELLRPALTTANTTAPIPTDIPVSKGWNLVPIISGDVPIPVGISADLYFGTLAGPGGAGWLRALSFDTLVRNWETVSPGQSVTLKIGATNPCTGRAVNVDSSGDETTNVEDGTEPCQVGEYRDRSDNDEEGTGKENRFDEQDTVTVNVPVIVGKGYWLYSTVDGALLLS